MGRREPLRFEEREIISRELSQGHKARYIGRLLGRHHSTIYDEIDRNGGATSYRAVDAQRRAEENRGAGSSLYIDRTTNTSMLRLRVPSRKSSTAPESPSCNAALRA